MGDIWAGDLCSNSRFDDIIAADEYGHLMITIVASMRPN
jgi:hypothetical protein